MQLRLQELSQSDVQVDSAVMEAEREGEAKGWAPSKEELEWRVWKNEDEYLAWKEAVGRYFSRHQRDFSLEARHGAKNQARFISALWPQGSAMKTAWETGSLTNPPGWNTGWVAEVLGAVRTTCEVQTLEGYRMDPALQPPGRGAGKEPGEPESKPENAAMEIRRGNAALERFWDALDVRCMMRWAHEETVHCYPEPVSEYIARFMRRWRVRVLLSNKKQ